VNIADLFAVPGFVGDVQVRPVRRPDVCVFHVDGFRITAAPPGVGPT